MPTVLPTVGARPSGVFTSLRVSRLRFGFVLVHMLGSSNEFETVD